MSELLARLLKNSFVMVVFYRPLYVTILNATLTNRTFINNVKGKTASSCGIPSLLHQIYIAYTFKDVCIVKI